MDFVLYLYFLRCFPILLHEFILHKNTYTTIPFGVIFELV